MIWLRTIESSSYYIRKRELILTLGVLVVLCIYRTSYGLYLLLLFIRKMLKSILVAQGQNNGNCGTGNND